MAEAKIKIGVSVDGLAQVQEVQKAVAGLTRSLSGLTKASLGASPGNAMSKLATGIEKANVAAGDTKAMANYETTLRGVALAAAATAASIKAVTDEIKANAAAIKSAGAAAGKWGATPTPGATPSPAPAAPPKGASNWSQILQAVAGGFAAASGGATGFTAAVMGLSGAFLGLKAAGTIITELVHGMEQLAEVGAEAERAFARFKIMDHGDATKASEEIQFTGELARRTGVDLANLREEYSRLALATQETGISESTRRNLVVGVAEYSAAMRASKQDTKDAMLSMVKMGESQLVTLREYQMLSRALPGVGDELRHLLVERGLLPVKDASESAEQAMHRFFSKATVEAKEFMPLIGEALHNLGTKGNGGDMTGGVEASFNRVKNAVFDLESEIGQSGVNAQFKVMGDTIAAAFDNPATREGLKFLAEGLGQLGIWIAKAIAWCMDLAGDVYKAFVIAGYGIKSAWNSLSNDFSIAISWLKEKFSEFFAWLSSKGATASRALAGFARSFGFDGVATQLESVAKFRDKEAEGWRNSAARARGEQTKTGADRNIEQAKLDDNLTRRLKELNTPRSSSNLSMYDPNAPKGNPQGASTKPKKKKGGDPLKAEEAYQEALAAQTIQQAKDLEAREDALLADKLARHLIAEKQYNEERTKNALKALDVEIDAERKNIDEKKALQAKETDAVKKHKYDTDIVKAQTKLDSMLSKRYVLTVDADATLAKLQEKMRDMKLSLKVEIETADGHTLEGALDTIQQKYKKLRLEAPDSKDDEYFAKLDRREAQETAGAHTADAERKSSEADRALSLREADIKRQQTAGALTEYQAERETQKAREASADALQKQLEIMQAQLAVTPENTDLALKIEEMRSKIADLRVDAKDFGTEFKRSFADSIADALKNAKTFGDFFKSILTSVLTFLRDKLAKGIGDSIYGALMGKSDSGSGSVLDGIKDLFGDGKGGLAGTLKNAFSGLGSMFKSLLSGLGSLFSGGGAGGGIGSLFAGIGSLLGFADGGHLGGGKVEGPGSEKSDSILARLSRGEFVIPAASVRKVGLGALEHIRKFGAMPMPTLGFATGGSIGNANFGRMTLPTPTVPNLHVSMSPILHLDPDHAANAVTSSDIFRNAVHKVVLADKERLGL